MRPNLPGISGTHLEGAVYVADHLPATCDVNAVKTDARAYARRSNDVLLSILGELQQAARNGVGAASADKAFDALARVAAIRGTADQKAGVTGVVFDRLVHGLIACMPSVLYADVLEPDGGFGGALGPGWVFEVRGKDSDVPPGRPEGAYERPIQNGQWWAVETRGTASWADAIQSNLAVQTGVLNCATSPTHAVCNRVFIFGYRTDFLGDPDGKFGSAFEHRSLPKITPDPSTAFKVAANIGLCYNENAPIVPAAASDHRVNHDNTFLARVPADCDDPVEFALAGGSVFDRLNPAMLARRAVSFLAPQPLYAASMLGLGSVTGSPDDWSPSAVYDLSQITLVFDTIADGFVNTELKNTAGQPVRVWALSPDNVPIPGVDIVLTIAGNSSTLAFLNDGVTSLLIEGTPDGYAVLNGVSVTKAGGYQLAARVSVAGVEGTTQYLSLLFNVQNKAAP